MTPRRAGIPTAAVRSRQDPPLRQGEKVDGPDDSTPPANWQGQLEHAENWPLRWGCELLEL